MSILHYADGSTEARRLTEILLEPGESFASVEERLSPTAPIAVETIVRLAAPQSRLTTEVYVRSDETRTELIDSIEIGVIASDEAPADAVPVPDVEGLSAYIKLEP
jgi:hypothetical protein